MRILILNWRDIKNPASGGAEILTHEIAKRLVLFGNDVTQFSSYFPGSKNKEIVDGVSIIRGGGADTKTFLLPVHLKAFIFYLKNRNFFDLIIDEAHGVPFFTPLYTNKKKVILICEVANDLWRKKFGFFIGMIGELIEKFYLSKIYENIPYITISQSTKKDLILHGIDKNNISILPMGITVPDNVKKEKKEKKPTFIFVGRLNPEKGIEDALMTFQEIQKKYKKAYFWVLGRGSKSYSKHLVNLSKKLSIDRNVKFFGFVPEEKKFALLSRAHILIHTSIREGFGLTIPEAGYVGTPVIAYNSPGLRDIVKNGRNGILLKNNQYNLLAKEAFDIMNNPELYKKICKGAEDEAKKYSWNKTAKAMFKIIKKL